MPAAIAFKNKPKQTSCQFSFLTKLSSVQRQIQVLSDASRDMLETNQLTFLSLSLS